MTTMPPDSTPPSEQLGGDWPDKAVSFIDLVVDTINDRVIRPVILVGRAIVFGLLIAALVIVVAVAIGVAILRLLDVYLFPDQVWISYAILGSITSIIGLVAWSRRNAESPDEPT